MDHPEAAGLKRADRWILTLLRLEFRGAQIRSDGGLLPMRELDDALGLSCLASTALRDTRLCKNTVHRLDGLLRKSVFGRLAGYEDVNDADRLALDPVMRHVVGGRAVEAQAASASQIGRFETETLPLLENRAALADLNGQWTQTALRAKERLSRGQIRRSWRHRNSTWGMSVDLGDVG